MRLLRCEAYKAEVFFEISTVVSDIGHRGNRGPRQNPFGELSGEMIKTHHFFEGNPFLTFTESTGFPVFRPQDLVLKS